MSFFAELKRRNVIRVGVAYIVAAWVFLQVADLVLDAINAPDWVLQALLLLSALGFIAAVIVAWAYEVTPEGIRREKEVTREESITHQTAHKLDRLTIALVITGIAVVAVDRMVPEQGPAGSVPVPTNSGPVATPAQPGVSEPTPDPAPLPEKSVAVLPFVNMSSDPEQEYFSDGISEEILNVLTRIPNLKVAARTSSFQFKGQTMDVADIARQLKVNHILEGSVRKAGNQLRITAQLIEAESGYHLWSDTYDRQLEDVFAIQDEIATAIAGELRARLSGDPIEASTVVDVEAYELYLKGLGLVATRNEEDLFAAFELLEEALEIEPGYVPAMATLARGYVVAPYFTTRESPRELREKGRHWASRALELEPYNTDALSVMAVIVNEQDLDSERALRLLRKAIQSNPGNLAANNFLGDVLFRSGDLDSAIIYESKASEIDPLAPVHLSDLAFVYLAIGDYDRVLELSERALSLNPAFPNAHQGRIDAYWARGDLENLERAIKAQIDAGRVAGPDALALLARLDLARGDDEAAREKLLEFRELAESDENISVSLAFEAVIHQDFDMAGEMLLRAYDRKIGNWTFPLYVRLPEQAPDSGPWQEFWSLPEPARLAEIRRANGFEPNHPAFGEAAE